MKKEHIVLYIVFATFLVSFVSLGISCYRAENNLSFDYLGLIVGILALLVTVLIGLQLYNYIYARENIKQIVNEEIRKMVDDYDHLTRARDYTTDGFDYIVTRYINEKIMDRFMKALQEIIKCENLEMRRHGIEYVMNEAHQFCEDYRRDDGPRIYKRKRDEIVAKKGVEEEHKKKLDEELYKQSKLLKVLIEKNNQLEKINQQAEYCKKCRNVLKETRLDLLEESRKEMEEETFDTFNRLLWKKDAFSKVEILEDYTFRLLDIYGSQTLGSCSAAERALLALSFTLALQKVSMHDSLLFIDTPIGRVDQENRLNFVNTLCEIAKGKQVILTFTPVEYDDKVAAALQGQYASFSKLQIEDGITVIK